MEETEEEAEGGVIVGKEHDFSISKEKAEWLYEGSLFQKTRHKSL